MNTTKIKLPLGWLLSRMRGEAAHVSVSEIIHFVKDKPWQFRASAFIESMEEQNSFVIIRLKGYPGELYWPSEISLDSLKFVLVEQLEVDHWHNYETPETRVVSTDVIADCGASEGLFSFLHTDCRKILAFEPNPTFIQSLQHTFRKTPNVIIVPHALGATNGTASFKLDTLASAVVSADQGTKVVLETLDFAASRLKAEITFIKADLEGAELDFLAGAVQTIFENKPRISITAYHVKAHAEQISRIIRKVHPSYKIKWKGYTGRNHPLMVHCWI